MFKRKSKIVGRDISGPISVSHGLHVDTNFEWSGPEAAGQFVFGEKLGEGSFGAVYRATHKTAKTEFAIKTIPVQASDELSDIEHEISILKVCSITINTTSFDISRRLIITLLAGCAGMLVTEHRELLRLLQERKRVLDFDGFLRARLSA